MSMSELDMTAKVILSVAGVVALLFGVWRKVLPAYRHAKLRLGGTIDTLAGRDAIVDRATGKELSPEIPSLAVRLDSYEQSLSKIADLIADKHEQDERIAKVESRIEVLERASAERLAAKVESAAMLNLVASERADTSDEES